LRSALTVGRRRNKQLALHQIAAVAIETWSTTDLIAERTRIRNGLYGRPTRELYPTAHQWRQVKGKTERKRRARTHGACVRPLK
jgi:hypothetical protein